MLDDRLDRREAGAASDQKHRLWRVFTQKEAAQWASQAQQVALTHAAEDVFGEPATCHAADMQLQDAVVVRRIGEREGSPLAVLEQDVHVLAGEELQPLAARQAQLDDHHIWSGKEQPVYARRQRADGYVGERVDLPAFDAEVGVRRGATEERESGQTIGVAENRARGAAVGHLTAQDATAAAAADAVAAAIRQVQTLPECGREDALARCDGEGMTARLEHHLVIHCLSVRVAIR